MSREYALRPFPGAGSTRIRFEDELNPEQLAAVTAGPGPALVLAGAGAGKTRTLTYRVAWLLDRGVVPERILLLTFTNRAAREMMQRVTELVGGGVGGLWGGTFHSLGLRVLRRHPERVGYREGFTIADREDARDLLAACIVEAGIDVRGTRFPKAEALGDLYSMAINTGRTLPDLLSAEYASWEELAGPIADVRRLYAERKQAAGVMDFDDLLDGWRRLLKSHADLRDFYQQRFEWVLVDEYQDTNVIQGELIDLLSARHGNVMAVGDDAQSIYSWRGAHFANILEFPRRHPAARVYRIETNYRSTPEILAVANAAIAGNVRQFPKELRAAREAGPLPGRVQCGDAREQAAFVAQRVEELHREGRPLADVCVLYRSHFHALELQLELTRRNIPFAITSGIRFFEQAHIKDAVAHLKLLENPRDEVAFRRLVRMLPGVGARTADKMAARLLARVAEVAPAPPEAVVVSDNDGGPEAMPPGPRLAVAPILAGLGDVVPRKAAAGWAELCATLAQCEAPDTVSSPSRILRRVLDAGYADHLQRTYENARNRLDDLEQLAVYGAQFGSTAEFLSELALQSGLEAAGAAAADGGDEETDRLRLSTIHQAKGLEFGVVFVIMLCEGLFPTGRSLENPSAEEEERRLFYVAVTRARDELYLVHPQMRFLPGSGETWQMPSRFLGEIPEPLTEAWNLSRAPRFPSGGGGGWGGDPEDGPGDGDFADGGEEADDEPF